MAAALVVVAFAIRNRTVLRLRLVPWRLLVFVTGLFLVVQTIGLHGLDMVTHALIGSGGGALGALRTAATGAGLSNAVNNLPAYVASESVIPFSHHNQLLALLIGTNVGPDHHALGVPCHPAVVRTVPRVRCRSAAAEVHDHRGGSRRARCCGRRWRAHADRVRARRSLGYQSAAAVRLATCGAIRVAVATSPVSRPMLPGWPATKLRS